MCRVGNPRLVRDWPTFLTAGVPGHVRPDPAPEAAGPGIFFLERNLPASRVQPEQLQGGCMPDMLLARRADDEEVTHDPGPGGQPADKNEPGQSGIGADQVAASVRIKEVGRQPTGRVEPLIGAAFRKYCGKAAPIKGKPGQPPAEPVTSAIKDR